MWVINQVSYVNTYHTWVYRKWQKSTHKNQQLPRALSLAGKLQGNKADQSPPSSAMVKNEWRYTLNLPYAFMVRTGAILLLLYFTLLYVYKKMGIIISQHNQNQYTITVMAEFFHTECKQNVTNYSECQILQVVLFLNFSLKQKISKTST